MSDKPFFPPNIALFISILAVSSASILIKWSEADPLAIATYRLLFATLILTPMFLKTHGLENLRSAGFKVLLNLILIGIVLAMHFATWITSLGFTSVANSTILVHVDPIFIALFSHFYLQEPLDKRMLTGVFLAFTGILLIAYGDFSLGRSNLKGDVLAFIGGLMLAIYILSGRKMRQRLSIYSYATPVYGTSSAFLALSCLLTKTRLISYPMKEIILFILIALIPMILGHTLYNWALKYIKAVIVSVSLLGEPIGATILAFIFLGEVPNSMTIIGGSVTLIGIYLCSHKN